jgi:hypothetical protein
MTTQQPDERPPLMWEQLHTIRERIMNAPPFSDATTQAEVEEAILDMMQLGQMENVPSIDGNVRMRSIEQMQSVLSDIVWWAENLREVIRRQA